MIAVPGLIEAKIRMECLLEQSIPLGGSGEEGDAPACDLLIGRVVRFHFDEAVYEDGHIRPDKLNPMSRLAGNDYAKLGARVTVERPQ